MAPKNPRAVFFNDEISVGWVPGSESLEILAMDPLKGANFYALDVDAKSRPQFLRIDGCLACHAGTTTLQVPGWIVRSFLVDRNGKPIVGYSRITHASKLNKRWGGWYVTGRHGTQIHRGNIIGKDANQRFRTEEKGAGNVTDLCAFVDLTRYPAKHSDLVAHLVLNHQAHGLNLITRVGYEERFGRKSDAEAQLLRYLLFLDETPLTAPVSGTSGYRRWFANRGPFDSKKRSLRQFDLKSRTFKYRLSYLIYSRAFDGLPKKVKARFYRSLWNVLTGRDASPDFRKIPAAERQAILEILRETKPDLPPYWKRP